MPRSIAEAPAATTSDAWKLVPVAPTEEMIEAHFLAHARAKTVFADVRDIWSAMLASAPASPAIGIQAVKALEALINDVQEWVDAVGRGTSWDYWDHHYKHLAYGGLDKYRAAIEAALHPAPEAASAGGECCSAISPCSWQRHNGMDDVCPLCIAATGSPVSPPPSDSAPSPKGAQEEVHPDDLAVDRFAAAMKAKLAKKRAEGRGGWEDKDDCAQEFLSQLLREHVEKGDPLDVGNLSMMLHQRGERITAPSPKGVSDGVREARQAALFENAPGRKESQS